MIHGLVDEVLVISIHALHEESDLRQDGYLGKTGSFQSTLSMRRATSSVRARNDAPLFQSTLSMRRATSDALHFGLGEIISIHALHEESDTVAVCESAVRQVFQSTLSMRRATTPPQLTGADVQFQSTLSMRRATVQLDIFVRFLRRNPAA